MDKQQILDELGQLIIDTRDHSIEWFDKYTNNPGKTDQAKQYHEFLSRCSEKQVREFREIVITLVDKTLHSLLHGLEGSDNMHLVHGDREKYEAVDIIEMSDGIGGELYTEEGWIYRFSEFKEQYR